MRKSKEKILEEVDITVGKNLRSFRKIAKMSLQDLASKSGITYQQIQKYECGTNRISASRLHEFATVLNVKVSDFFRGTQGNAPKPFIFDDIDKDTAEMLRLFRSISDEKVKKGLLKIIKTYVDST
ncbi:MAG: helix-turn-helix domain-containing protein [Beijerinckiaceae bacterium]